jgi:Zn-dependent M16 (insulinase) family peptidase
MFSRENPERGDLKPTENALKNTFSPFQCCRLFRSVTESSTEVFDILAAMSDALLRADNVRGIALNMTDGHRAEFVRQTENFVKSLPKDTSRPAARVPETPEPHPLTPKTFVSTQFPVHYCALALPTVHYAHEDSAPLRILVTISLIFDRKKVLRTNS